MAKKEWNRTVPQARNQDLETPADVAKVQEHNEREKGQLQQSGHRAGTHFSERPFQSTHGRLCKKCLSRWNKTA